MLTALDIRKVRCLDGLHYSFELLKGYYDQLWETCCKILTNHSQAIPALAACWGFIDALHRIREIAQSIPGLSAKHPEMRAFLAASSLSEDYRHYIQHLRGELAKDPPNTFPVWGTLSWVDQSNIHRTYAAILGAQIEGTQYTGCVYDTFENRWVSKVCLGVGGKSFNFDSIFESIIRFESFIMPYLKEGLSPKVQLRETLPILSVDLVHSKQESGKLGIVNAGIHLPDPQLEPED